MSALVNSGGDESICHFDLFCPSRKRTRINDSYSFRGGEPAETKQISCSIDTLPDECLFEILRLLPGPQERSVSACVSKRWLSVLSNIRASEISSRNDESREFVKGSLSNLNEPQEMELDGEGYGHLTRSLKEKDATDIRLAALAVGNGGRGGLGKLLIRGSHPTRGISDIGLSAIARGCPSLRLLALWKVNSVTDAGLAEIAAGCPMLEKVDICECPLITDKGLIALARYCPNLKSLAIEGCPGINNEGLQAIGRSCSKLCAISIKNCPLLGDPGIVGLVTAASASLMKIKLQNLNITDLSLAVIGYYGKAVTDLSLTGLQNVAERGFWVMGSALGMQKLKSLFITACRGVTDRGLDAIANGCPSLKQLCLRRCCYLSDNGLKAFVEAAALLESLQLEECNRITLIGVVASLLNCKTKFKTLSLVKCMGIKDMDFYPELPVCDSLRSLTIRDCPGFTSSNLAFVGKICPNLQQLDLSGLVGITNAGLLPLIDNSSSGMEKVSLNGCINLTDATVFALVKGHGLTLQLLHLDGCKNVTDRSLLAISDGCSMLDDLDLSRCSISDYGVAALASARQLDMHTLALAGCSKVTEKSLPFLGNMGHPLVGLNLQGCNLISTNGINLLETKLWWCDILS